MNFKTATNGNLNIDGFSVYINEEIKKFINVFSTDLETIAEYCDNRNVFRTKLGDIKQIQNLQNATQFKQLNRLLAEIIGATEYEVLNNQYFCKPPNYKMTTAHQDNAYLDSNEEIYTFWIPLQDVDILNSCMFYVPGSHFNGLVEHKPIGTNTRTRTGTKGVSLYSDVFKNSSFVKVPMKRGEILIHDKNTMHFSSPNLSDDYRIALTCIMKVIKKD